MQFLNTVKHVGVQVRKCGINIATQAKNLYCKAHLKYQAIKTTPAFKVLCTVGKWVWKVLHYCILMIELHEVWVIGLGLPLVIKHLLG